MITTPKELRAWSGGGIDLSCECDKGVVCSTWTGRMNGDCCFGLRRAAIRHLGMFLRGGCSVAEAKKRLDTLADTIDRVQKAKLCEENIP